MAETGGPPIRAPPEKQATRKMMRIWTLILLASMAVAGVAAFAAVSLLRDAPDGSGLSLQKPILSRMAGDVSKPAKDSTRPAAAARVTPLRDLYGPEIDALAPHKAIYDINMVERSSGSQILNVGGRMYYEWKPSCDAWVTDHRFSLNYEYTESAPLKITSEFTTYEPYSGESFDFTSRRRRDGALFQELRGRAQVKGDGGLAAFSMPEDLSFDLPAGTMFPMAHTLAVMKAVREDRTFFNAPLFDGSDEEGPVEVNAFIGKPVTISDAQMQAKGIDPALLSAPARSVHMAFFPLDSNEAGSDYEMDAVLHDNGVISDMFIAYGDFSVTQTLVALEPVMGRACAGTGAP